MTSRVTVGPAAHRIEVTVWDGNTHKEEILEAGGRARDYYVYDDRTVTVREIPASSNEGT